jgi:hypothetical protein
VPFIPFSVGQVEIYNAKVGGALLATLTPAETALGLYQVTWDIPTSVGPCMLYDRWSWVAAQGMAGKTQTFEFQIETQGAITPEPPQDVIITGCGNPAPTWLQAIGVIGLQSVGNGIGLEVAWQKAKVSDETHDLYYNIYYSRSRVGVFQVGPVAITNSDSAIINVSPGLTYYAGVRATEFSTSFDITELDQIGANLYQYPAAQILNADMDAYGATVTVESTEGYPSDGYLQVGFEIMSYDSLDGYNFYIPELGRGEYGTAIVDHYMNEGVNLWQGFEDGNSNIMQCMGDWLYYNPATQSVNGPPQDAYAIGQYNVDSDGYHAQNENDLTTNLVASDESTIGFSSYDYTGYHRPSIQESMRGESCLHSYLGGIFNGLRGFAYQDRILSQLDAMLQLTGEACVLLQRKWTGVRCRCFTVNREHARERCPYCFGVGIEGGFNRYINPRAVSEKFCNTQGLIMVRVEPTMDDLDIIQDTGLRQNVEPGCWTLSVPSLRDRDVILRFTQDGLPEFMYEVLNVTRNKLFFGESGRQEFKMKRLDKTDQIYAYPTAI